MRNDNHRSMFFALGVALKFHSHLQLEWTTVCFSNISTSEELLTHFQSVSNTEAMFSYYRSFCNGNEQNLKPWKNGQIEIVANSVSIMNNILFMEKLFTEVYRKQKPYCSPQPL